MYPLVRRATATAAASPSLLIVCQAQNKRLSFQKTNLSNGGEGGKQAERGGGGGPAWLSGCSIYRPLWALPACLPGESGNICHVCNAAIVVHVVCGGRSAFFHFHLQGTLIEIRYNNVLSDRCLFSFTLQNCTHVQ